MMFKCFHYLLCAHQSNSFTSQLPSSRFQKSYTRLVDMTYIYISTMKNLQFLAVATIIFLLHNLDETTADNDISNDDKELLLKFSSSFPQPHKLTWSSTIRNCKDWVGIKCNEKGNVTDINLPTKGLYGPIPNNTIGKLRSLKVLSLRYNFLNGSLPYDIISNPSLQNLYLQHNNFSGTVPTNVSPSIMALDLSNNSFTGNIPETLKDLTRLTTLKLQFNYFLGPVPDFIHCTKLHALNLSHNKLNGPIPFSLQKFQDSSFSGNEHLCGPPLNRCPTSRKLTNSAILAIAIGSFLLIAILLCCFLKKNDRVEIPLIVEGNKETQGLVSAVDNHVSQLVIVVSSLHYKCNIPKDRLDDFIISSSHFSRPFTTTTVSIKRLRKSNQSKRVSPKSNGISPISNGSAN
uniref:Leucine-rich repeat-containing N-terminal plant-type domain-containing protein n=1 Tax=Lactuca sativa TaxID=4236 RepID=A0A9R1W820_LACSA|nr:hypothetical protein LSAT_V11C200097330 [Lactuca sativa]